MAEAGWSQLHHGIDPDRLPFVRAWLRLVFRAAGPLRAVPPMVLTVLGALFALAALGIAGGVPWLALVLVLLAVCCDALDGAVAVLSRRATRFGAVADKTADRIADCAFALVIWRCGAPWPLAVAAAGLSLLHEGWREARGGSLRTRITVAERPTRVICTTLACLCAAAATVAWPATVCAAVWVGLALIGVVQLARA